MKKLLFLFSAVFMLACSGESDDSPNTNAYFNPPAWIKGTWMLQGSSILSGFKFTNDDFCTILQTTIACNREAIQQQHDLGLNAGVTETITDTDYTVVMNFQGMSITYHFRKATDNRIQWVNAGVGAPAYYSKQ